MFQTIYLQSPSSMCATIIKLTSKYAIQAFMLRYSNMNHVKHYYSSCGKYALTDV